MMQLDLFPLDVHLRCIDSSRNKRRFYQMTVQRDLFGEWVLMREWGRIGCAGRSKSEQFGHANLAAEKLSTVMKQKILRGYACHGLPIQDKSPHPDDLLPVT